nr:epimerase family protein SDR39U1 isoform X4 [Paramormyrops kingsleyae]
MHPLRWWNESFKKDLFSSRIDTTRSLAKAIASSSSPPRAWVLVTGVACYKPSQTMQYTEETEWNPFNLFSLLVKEWEAAGSLPENVARNTRHVVVRSGLVLGADGGAIKQMLPPFRLGLGGPLGSGQQPFPWIHVADLAGIIARSLEPPSKPVPSIPEIYNGVAPAQNTNYEFTKALGRVLRRPAVLPAPRLVLQALLGVERAAVLTEGQWVLPKRTLESGYEFQYLNLESALKEIVRS